MTIGMPVLTMIPVIPPTMVWRMKETITATKIDDVASSMEYGLLTFPPCVWSLAIESRVNSGSSNAVPA